MTPQRAEPGDPGEPARIDIRRVGADEGLMLRDIRLRSLAESPEAFGQTVAEARERPIEEWHAAARAAAVGDRRAWLVAERHLDGSAPLPVGLVLGRRRPPDSLLIFSMWVDPAIRHRGIGRRLIEALEGWAAGWGGRHSVLWVFHGNEPAIRFYARLGFTVEDSGQDAVTGAQYGALAMSRRIRRPEPGTGTRPSAR